MVRRRSTDKDFNKNSIKLKICIINKSILMSSENLYIIFNAPPSFKLNYNFMGLVLDPNTFVPSGTNLETTSF